MELQLISIFFFPLQVNNNPRDQANRLGIRINVRQFLSKHLIVEITFITITIYLRKEKFPDLCLYDLFSSLKNEWNTHLKCDHLFLLHSYNNNNYVQLYYNQYRSITIINLSSVR